MRNPTLPLITRSSSSNENPCQIAADYVELLSSPCRAAMFPLERQMGTAVEQLGLPAVITFKGLISSPFSPLNFDPYLRKVTIAERCGA
jgi:hypothetical protein